ncbi:MAG: phosphodiester glycosidase family protein [Candidatus Peribacteria bacterium]|nr:phosphodiester glycosidase family protein [Candidatus Peribacteria bacterium]
MITSGKSQTAAYNILTQDFGCSKVITFDGGGSSQLMCNGVEKVTSSDYSSTSSRREIPIAIVIKENGVN